MTTWRLPDRAERERDRRYLEHFLSPEVAARIASMPVVIIDPPAPLSMRIAAFLWRCHYDQQWFERAICQLGRSE